MNRSETTTRPAGSETVWVSRLPGRWDNGATVTGI
jgi:hypothetical protein